MIIACHHITKEFVEKTVLSDITFHLEKGDRAAIVGANGAGKTTLLRIMAGQMEADAGTVTLSGGARLGYLAQDQGLDAANTIYEEGLSAKRDIIEMEARLARYEREMEAVKGRALDDLIEDYTNLLRRFEDQNGYAYKGEIIGVLRGLGFADEEFDKPVATLSGGQKTRVALAKLLLAAPDVIMLDEPTNHLDLGSIRWLENYLAGYRGTVLIVSHDRYFLDRTVSKVIEIENAKATFFTGNYSVYAEKKKALRDQQRRAWLNNQAQIKHQEEVIARLKQFNREKSIKRAESREKMLGRMEVLDKPFTLRDDMRLQLTPCIKSGREVLTVEGLGKGFGGAPLFSGLSFRIRRGEHVALIGDNGTGKTTILKILNGLLFQDAGHIRLGTNVHIGYYDQEHHVLDDANTVFEEIAYAFPAMTNTEVRSLLAAFLFTGDDVFKLVGDLSGGEKGRVSLAKLMLSEANFLILDEPTNHLDITSREVLENALNAYDGTVLYVSHDRYFINRTASRIMELTRRLPEGSAPSRDGAAGQAGRAPGEDAAAPPRTRAMGNRAGAGATATAVLVNYPGSGTEGGPDKYMGNYDFYLEKSAQVGDALIAGQREQAPGREKTGRPGQAGPAGSSQGKIPSGAGLDPAPQEPAPAGSGEADSGAGDWKARKEAQARRRKIENDLKKCEAEIARLEAEGEDLDARISLPENSTDPDRLRDLTQKRGAIDGRLASLYEEWERLGELAQ